MEHHQAVESHEALEVGQELLQALGRADFVAGDEGVAGVEADRQARVALHFFQDGGQFFQRVGHVATGAGRIFDDEQAVSPMRRASG